MVDRATIEALMLRMLEQGSPHPDLIMMAPEPYAAMRAAVEFNGRDRRRGKREINTAVKRARLAERLRESGSTQTGGLTAWRTSAS